jgi:hypothetical protein
MNSELDRNGNQKIRLTQTIKTGQQRVKQGEIITRLNHRARTVSLVVRTNDKMWSATNE